MPGLRSDKFIEILRHLSQEYPEYFEILELLIEHLEQGREDEIKTLLENMIDDDEWE